MRNLSSPCLAVVIVLVWSCRDEDIRPSDRAMEAGRAVGLEYQHRHDRILAVKTEVLGRIESLPSAEAEDLDGKCEACTESLVPLLTIILDSRAWVATIERPWQELEGNLDERPLLRPGLEEVTRALRDAAEDKRRYLWQTIRSKFDGMMMCSVAWGRGPADNVDLYARRNRAVNAFIDRARSPEAVSLLRRMLSEGGLPRKFAMDLLAAIAIETLSPELERLAQQGVERAKDGLFRIERERRPGSPDPPLGPAIDRVAAAPSPDAVRRLLAMARGKLPGSAAEASEPERLRARRYAAHLAERTATDVRWGKQGDELRRNVEAGPLKADILALLDDPDAEVRRAILRLLRHVPLPPGAADKLAAMHAGDPDAVARFEAGRASNRPPTRGD